MPTLIRGLLQGLLVVVMLLSAPQRANASEVTPTTWMCDGDLLTLAPTSGSVDFNGLLGSVPNVQAGTVPGDGVLIEWRGMRYQLPRTNNAGAPSYTDGRWWWRAEDPLHPEWKQRRGGIITYACDATLPSA